MAITLHATTPPPRPNSMTSTSTSASSSSSSLPSHSHSNHSSSSFGSLACITVRKDDADPSAKAGIQMEQDSNGQVTVTNIATNGLFGDTDLAIGDIVLAVNKKRLSQGEGPEVLMNVVHKNATICLSIKKPSPPGAPLTTSRGRSRRRKPQTNRNTNRNRLLWGSDNSNSNSNSSHHHKSSTKPKKPPRNNNSFQINTYYGGLAQHNADGSLKIQRTSDPSTHDRDCKPIKTLTISATKPQVPDKDKDKDKDPTRSVSRNKSFGSTLQGQRSRSKSPHPTKTKLKMDCKSTHNTSNNSRKNATTSFPTKESVGLTLGVADDRLVVTAILAKSIFRHTKLRLGDVVLSINDMSFRKFADSDYATTIMDKARLMVTLVVERPMDDADDTDRDADDDDEDSLSSFGHGNDDDDNDNDAAALDSSYDADASAPFSYSFTSHGEALEIETDFKIEKYRPVTISVPKSRRSQTAGLVFKMVRTQKQGLYNPTISYLHPDAPAWKQQISRAALRQPKATWIYVHKIEPDSIFTNTSLRRGDKIVCINNVNLKDNPDPRAAYRACSDSKEAIAMVVLKDDPTIYKEKGFEFDRSSEDLHWKA